MHAAPIFRLRPEAATTRANINAISTCAPIACVAQMATNCRCSEAIRTRTWAHPSSLGVTGAEIVSVTRRLPMGTRVAFRAHTMSAAIVSPRQDSDDDGGTNSDDFVLFKGSQSVN